MTIDDHSETRSIEGEIAVITGGGTGIGRGIALALARAKIAVVICGRRPKPIEDTAMEIVAAGGEALALPADVSDEDDVERLVARTLQKYGKVDLLINNAGIGGSGSIHDHDIHTWDRVIAVNLRGPFLMARAILPHMRAQRSGHIINISSEAGLEFYPGNGAYGVAKHALNALSEYVQRENQEFDIRVDTICPGMVVSEMTSEQAGLDHTKCLQPGDIADLVLWLVSRRRNVKIGKPILIQTMLNPWA